MNTTMPIRSMCLCRHLGVLSVTHSTHTLTKWGPFMWLGWGRWVVPICPMSILRKATLRCHTISQILCHLKEHLMSRVDVKKWSMSCHRFSSTCHQAPCRCISILRMSVSPCRLYGPRTTQRVGLLPNIMTY